MPATFLDRNKKKSLLAALLLFIRQRKMMVVLLLLVLAASTIFLGPSSWVTGLPGGTRFAAGVAWVAGKMGVDVSKWGLGPDKHSYADLLTAFREARAESTGDRVAIGWGAFFQRGAPYNPSAAPNSLDFVKGSKADLAHGVGADGGAAGGAGGGPQSIAGVVDPSDPKNRDQNAVAISEADLGGEREGFVKQAFAGGFMNGLLGGVGISGGGAAGGLAAGGDAASLSGGAYAGKGFFSGSGGAAGAANGLAQNGLAGVPAVASPSSTKGGKATGGSLSAMASRAVAAQATKGAAAAGTIGGDGNLAYTQLAEGGARDQLSTTYCQPPGCPPEYAATNTGAIYDGSSISAGFLTSSDPGGDSSGLINSSVDVPPDDAVGASGDAQNMATCAGLVQQCASSKQAPMEQEGVDETQLENWYGQMPGACGNPCNCGPCNTLSSEITNLCNGDMATQIALANAPCAPLPDYCGALGFTSPQSTMQGTGQNLCQQNMFKCSCGFLCGLMCML